MKKLLSFTLAFLLAALMLTACAGGSGSEESSQGERETPIPTLPLVKLDGTQRPTSQAPESYEKCDVDVSGASTIVAHTQLRSVVDSANDYLGKTIKMHGLFNAYKSENGIYFYCSIDDPANCCGGQFNMPFIPKSGLKYPDDYPQNGEECTVAGVFDLLYDNGQLYYHLAYAEITRS